jgi:hypothetical protein
MLADVSLAKLVDLPQERGADEQVLLGSLGVLRHGGSRLSGNEVCGLM